MEDWKKKFRELLFESMKSGFHLEISGEDSKGLLVYAKCEAFISDLLEEQAKEFERELFEFAFTEKDKKRAAEVIKKYLPKE